MPDDKYLSELWVALSKFFEVFTPDDLDEYVQLGERMTCAEVDALAELLAAGGHPNAAQLWTAGHQTDCMGAPGAHAKVYDARQVGKFESKS